MRFILVSVNRNGLCFGFLKRQIMLDFFIEYSFNGYITGYVCMTRVLLLLSSHLNEYKCTPQAMQANQQLDLRQVGQLASTTAHFFSMNHKAGFTPIRNGKQRLAIAISGTFIAASLLKIEHARSPTFLQNSQQKWFMLWIFEATKHVEFFHRIFV